MLYTLWSRLLARMLHASGLSLTFYSRYFENSNLSLVGTRHRVRLIVIGKRNFTIHCLEVLSRLRQLANHEVVVGELEYA